MICVYETRISAACPMDGKPDIYEATFTSEETIKCEDILEAIAPYAIEKAFQEQITADLARKLRCKVQTVGYHSGVKTTVIAP